MGARLTDVLKSAESSGLCLDKGSKLREWIKHLFVFVDTRLTPILKHYVSSHEPTSDVVLKVIENIKKIDPDYTFVPISSKPISISQVQTFSEPVEFRLTNGEQMCSAENSSQLGNDLLSIDTKAESKSSTEAKFLIGVLSTDSYIKKHLCLSDATGRCMCYIMSPKPVYRGSVVLITNWCFIPPVKEALNDFKGNIEVLSEPYILLNTGIGSSIMELPSKIESNFCTVAGCVTNISSCISVSKWYYIITVTISSKGQRCKEQILIANPKFAFWVNCIHDGCVVIIHNLQKMRIRSGQCSYSVMSTTSESKLTISQSAPRERSMTIIQSPSDDPLTKHGFIPCYVGRITEVLNENLGLYSLDEGKVILYGCYLLWEDAGRAMREGAVVSVTSVHYYSDANDTSSYLICCALSHIRVILPSTRLSRWCPVGHRGVTLMTNYFSQDKFLHHPRKLKSFLELLEKLCENFPFFSKAKLISCESELGSDFEVLRKLLFEKRNHTKVGAAWKRNFVEECLSPQHSCIFTRSVEKSSSSYHLMSLADLHNAVIRKAEVQYKSTEKKDFRIPVVVSYQNLMPDEQMQWNDNLFLLGCVMCSNETGKTYLIDKSGFIEFICHEESEISYFFQQSTDFLDCFVHVTKFAVVVEFSQNLHPPTVVQCSVDLLSERDPEKTNFSVSMYIVCSPQDVKILKKISGICIHGGYFQKLDMTEQSCTIGKTGRSEKKTEAVKGVTTSLMQVDSPVQSFISLYIIVVDLQHFSTFTAQALLLKSGHQVYNPFPTISLRFNGSLRWKPFMTPGNLLHVTSAKTLNNFLLEVTPYCTIKPCYGNDNGNLSESLLDQAKSIWKESLVAKCLKNTYSVSEVVTKRPTSQFTLRGVLKFRKIFLEKNSLLQRLQIADEETTDSICLYLGRLSDLTLPSGMIAGATIIVGKAKLFVSARGNMYMKYHPGMIISATPRVNLDIYRRVPVTDVIKSEKGGNPSLSVQNSTLCCHSLQISYLYDIYLGHNECTNSGQALKLHVFPLKISNAFINVNFYEDSTISFSSKCLIDDNTGNAILHFTTKTFDDFFRFINVGTEDKLKFLELCRNSTSPSIKYYQTVHAGENEVWPGRTKLDASKFDALAALVVICNAVSSTVVDSKMVVVKRLGSGMDSASGCPPAVKTGTIAVGSQEMEQIMSLKLEPLNFECIEVL